MLKLTFFYLRVIIKTLNINTETIEVTATPVKPLKCA